MSLPFDPIEHLRTDGRQIFDAAIRTGLDAPVTSCDGWTMADLVWHVGEVWHFWGWVVGERALDPATVAQYPAPSRVADDVLVDWARASHVALVNELIAGGATDPVWTWTGSPQPVSWVKRRMAHETAVHRWDAEQTVGDAYGLPPGLAADGIDEFLTFFLAAGEGEPLGGTVHLHCTDTDDVPGEWMIQSIEHRRIELTREHAKGDAAIRGRAHDLLLWLWGRTDTGLEVLGDPDVARRFGTWGRRG
jgi:uncharacterized protein (TIGR03083 family)